MYSVHHTFSFLFVQTSEGEDAADLSGPFAVTIRLKFLNDTERDVEANLVEKIGAFKRRNFTQAKLGIGVVLSACVADPGCLSRIPDPNFFHSASRIQGQKNFRINEFKYFNSTNCFYALGNMIRDVHLEHLDYSPIPDPGTRGVKKVLHHRSATLFV
jgi:hypothetical protein